MVEIEICHDLFSKQRPNRVIRDPGPQTFLLQETVAARAGHGTNPLRAWEMTAKTDICLRRIPSP
jgi:hypothetical protein